MSQDILQRLKSFKKGHHGTGKGLRYSISEMQGWRNEMEDAHCEITKTSKIDGWSFFAIFDGHGGSLCSKESANNLWKHIHIALCESVGVSSTQTSTNSKPFDELNEEQIIEAIKNGFYKCDTYLVGKLHRETYEDKSGTTVVACLITNKHLYLINCGDSRGLFVRTNNFLELVTYDHKPTQLKEKQRIQNAGGLIALNRVNGGLATSRGLGDFEYKNVPKLKPIYQFVSPEPDVYVIDRDFARDHFVVLACDGIWDVKPNEKVQSFVFQRLADLGNEKLNDGEPLMSITNDLIDSCFDEGSKDNMSVILIQFTQAASVNLTTQSDRIMSGKKQDTNVGKSPNSPKTF